jgi:methyl-accepting chemotaxis protein
MANMLSFRFGIFQKILLTTLCVSLIPLGSVWYLDHRATLDLTGKSVEQQLNSFATTLSTHVDDWVEMNQRMLLQNASLDAIASNNPEQHNPVLRSIIQNYPWTYLAFTTDSKGNNIGRSDGGKLTFYGDRDYFQQVIKGNKFGKQILIGKTSGKPALVLSTATYDAQAQVNGVIAIAMTLSELSDTVTTASLGKSGFAFLLDEKGEVIAHRNSSFTQSRADFSQHPAFIASSKQGLQRLVYADENGKKIVAGMVRTKQGWTLIAEEDYQEAYAPVQAANSQALTLLLITLVLVVVVAYLLSLKLATPIRSLTTITEQLSQGKFDVVITGLQRKDEIGDLAKAIDRLGTSIKVAIKRLKKVA